MRNYSVYLVAGFLVLSIAAGIESARSADPPISELTEECIFCHSSSHPGIVKDWKRSRHSRITPAEAMKKPVLKRRVSAKQVPDKLKDTVVGCAECHMLNPKDHKDTFAHNDWDVHVIVSPRDCSTCHPDEVNQFDKNLMAWARANLTENAVYQQLITAVNGIQKLTDPKTSLSEPDPLTQADSCFHCHGTEVKVTGKETRDTTIGEMEFPVLSGWPNQGVGRLNPDGSRGSCGACHSRHQFSIEMARKPYTCSQCHKGPDVPAYKAYDVSKHGNLFSALKGEWDFQKVPWTLGEDFSAPTCAACHVSLLTTPDGDTIVNRTHQMSDRLPWRILGLIYAHPHPESPKTYLIKNKNGLQLPTTLTNQRADEYLIDAEEMNKRRETLQKVCKSCHDSGWVDGHWKRLENTIETTNEMTLTATQILVKAWKEGLADNKTNFFDEQIEKEWVEQWLFFANSTRFASAMMGADYGVFANGRWYLSKNIQDMLDRLKFLRATKKAE